MRIKKNEAEEEMLKGSSMSKDEMIKSVTKIKADKAAGEELLRY